MRIEDRFLQLQRLLENGDEDLNPHREKILSLVLELFKIATERQSQTRAGSLKRKAETSAFASEIHDGILYRLPLAVREFQVAVSGTTDSEELKSELNSFLLIIDQEIKATKELLRRLLSSEPLIPSQSNLKLSLQELINTQSNVYIKLHISDSLLTWINDNDRLVSLVIKFFQQTAHNAIQRGFATELLLNATDEDNGVRLQTIDNGIGFSIAPPTTPSDFQSLFDKGHLGLALLHSFSRPFNATFSFCRKGSPLGGAQVELYIPAKKPGGPNGFPG